MPRIAPEVRLERFRVLIDAAWRCSATKRFSDLTVDDVCAAAGVSKGAFYGYFTGKQDLLFALLEDSTVALDQVMEELAAAPLGGGGVVGCGHWGGSAWGRRAPANGLVVCETPGNSPRRVCREQSGW